MTLITATIAYFRGALSELHQVRWPTRSQAIRLSAIVIAFTFVAAAIYGLIDVLLGEGMSLLLHFA